MLSAAAVERHNTRDSCWVVIAGHAYDVTDFLDKHPGGASSILRCAGKDATAEYDPIHPAGTIEKTLDKSTTSLLSYLGSIVLTGAKGKHLGPAEPLPPSSVVPASAGVRTDAAAVQAHISTLQRLDDFEKEAEKVLPRKAWVYYNSGADSETSKHSNRHDWTRITLRPRILRNVAQVNTRRRIMGFDSAWPFFIAPAAQARLGHPDGELCFARGAARYDIPYCTSNYSSIAHEQLASCLQDERKGGVLFYQLYVPVDKDSARERIQQARKLGFKALLITVDSAVVGKREEDDRYAAELELETGAPVLRTTQVSGSESILRGSHSSTLDWDDLTWIREEWGNSGPVLLKGIQTVEDALRAAHIGVDGIYLSNHGGRQLDYAPSSLRVLLEIRKFCPELLGKLEIYVDGGVRRGTDILKALCLGARGVGLGRPFMYAVTGYGTPGVCRAIEILIDEVQTSMRLMGVSSLDQLNGYYVNTAALELELPPRVDILESAFSSKL